MFNGAGPNDLNLICLHADRQMASRTRLESVWSERPLSVFGVKSKHLCD